MFKPVYVVCDEDTENDDPEARIWTLSEDPSKEGWNTDSGYDGYGLTKAKAEYYAKCINDALSR